MKITNQIQEMKLTEYPNMKKTDVLDFEELFNKIVYADNHKKGSEAIDIGVGTILKKVQLMIKEHS